MITDKDDETTEPQDIGAILQLWESLYQVDTVTEEKDYSDIAKEAFIGTNLSSPLIIRLEGVKVAVKGTRNWSTAGTDQVYGFWLKYISSCHEPLSRLITEALVNPDTIDESVTSLRTLLIAKTKQPGPGDFRPISIMNNVMKLVSKVILQTIKSILLDARLISEVQGAFGVNSIGSKELVLLDEVITGQHKGNLNLAWLDVKKAFDSVPHNYVRRLLRNLPIPHGAVNIIERFIEHLRLDWSY